jgi:hypothetical protein
LDPFPEPVMGNRRLELWRNGHRNDFAMKAKLR